jgi:hypothetical protein
MAELPTNSDTKPMNSTLEKPIDLDLLRKFCTPDRPEYSEPFNLYSYGGGDVVAINGQVVICVPKRKHPDLKEQRSGIAAQVWWAMGAVANNEEGVGPAKKAAVARIPKTVRESLNILPGLEFKNVAKVRIWVYGRTHRQRWEKIDQNGVVFFRWDGGVGCCVAEKVSPSNDKVELPPNGGSESKKGVVGG